MDKYILNGRIPERCDDLEAWGRWFETANWQVASDQLGAARVSTVFLGMDHAGLGAGPPLLFETMIFGGVRDREQWRCSTFDEAEAQHAAAVALARSGLH